MPKLLATLRSLVSTHLRNHGLVLTAAVLNLPLLCVILGRNLEGIPAHSIATPYAIGAILGYYGSFMILVVGSVSVVLAGSRKVVIPATTAIMALMLWALLLDGQVYSIYKFHIDFFWLGFVWRDADGMGITMAMWAAAAVALGAVVLFEVVVFHIAANLTHRRRWVMGGVGLCVVGLVGSQVVHIVAYEKNDERITSLTPRLPVYLPMRSHTNAVKYGDRLPGISRQVVEGSDGGSLHYPLEPLRFGTPDSAPYNLLIVLLESWRADSLNSEITPRLDSYAERSTRFEEHFSSGNSTIAGLFGLFYGIQPTYWESVKANSTRIHNPVLIDAIQDRNYEFGVFADSDFRRHKIQDTVFSGIRVHDRQSGHDTAERDVDLTRQVNRFLEERGIDRRPFMALAFYKASHFDYRYDRERAPFQPSTRLNPALVFPRENPELYRNDYRNALHYDDELVGRVLDRLAAVGLEGNTIVVVTTDHGEAFDDDGKNYWGHGSRYTRAQVQVPLIVHVPEMSPRRVQRRTSHLDLAPTLMRLMFECQSEARSFSDGVDLLSAIPKVRALVVASYFNHAVIVGNNVYESRPFGLKTYTLDGRSGPIELVPSGRMREIMTDLTRFLVRDRVRPTPARLAGP